MIKKIVNAGPTMKKIINTGGKQAPIDSARVASALGAERSLESDTAGQGPITLFLVRQELFNRLLSTGGRPALEGTTQRPKIPLSDKTWRELEAIADALASKEGTPSAGQVASVLITLALKQAIPTQATREEIVHLLNDLRKP
jgi:hypothetical protein